MSQVLFVARVVKWKNSVSYPSFSLQNAAGMILTPFESKNTGKSIYAFKLIAFTFRNRPVPQLTHLAIIIHTLIWITIVEK